jgi:hypothetical protein
MVDVSKDLVCLHLVMVSANVSLDLVNNVVFESSLDNLM